MTTDPFEGMPHVYSLSDVRKCVAHIEIGQKIDIHSPCMTARKLGQVFWSVYGEDGYCRSLRWKTIKPNHLRVECTDLFQVVTAYVHSEPEDGAISNQGPTGGFLT